MKGDGKPGAATSGTPGLGGRVQATYLSQGRITRCALTSPILSSAITRRQDTEAFLSHDVRKVYEALGIEKKEIKKGKPYQNYIEAAFNVTWNDTLVVE